MTVPASPLRNPPIVEAVLDLDCDLLPAFDLAVLEKNACERFQNSYPKLQKQLLHETQLRATAQEPPEFTTLQPTLQALQFLQDDGKQLVQVRAHGFSFNRLAPYSSLDDYVPEIERAWQSYVDLVLPVQIRVIRLRYINRILLPLTAGVVDLEEFLKIGPRLPDEALRLRSFLIQQASVEVATEHEVNLVLTGQAPENEMLPIILDVGVTSRVAIEPNDWSQVRSIVESLRGLKNRIFFNTLTDKCIALFQS